MRKYRYTREMPNEIKRKISISLKGHKHSEQTKRKISESMRKIWATIPKSDREKNNEKK